MAHVELQLDFNIIAKTINRLKKQYQAKYRRMVYSIIIVFNVFDKQRPCLV